MRMVSGSRSTSARVVIISLTNRPPPKSRQSRRNGESVMPAIGASTTGGHTAYGPILSSCMPPSSQLRTPAANRTGGSAADGGAQDLGEPVEVGLVGRGRGREDEQAHAGAVLHDHL